MNLVQLRRQDGSRTVARVEGGTLRLAAGETTTYRLAQDAIARGGTLEAALDAERFLATLES